MNTILKPLALTLIFIGGGFYSSIAQDSLQVATSQHKTEVVALRMEQELSLSKNQTQRVSVILMERFETLKQANSNKTKQLASANDVAVKKLAGVLTAQQLAQYNQIRSETKKQKDEYLKNNPTYKFTDQEKEMDF